MNNTKCIVVGNTSQKELITKSLIHIDDLMICDSTQILDEMIYEFKNSHPDLDSPEMLVEKKKKPHHVKRRKGWER